MPWNDASLRGLIETALARTLEPECLEVIDESAAHIRHAGHRPGGESHFRVRIVSLRFVGQSRIERHRMVHDILRQAFSRGMHALAIEAAAPGEPAPWRER